jgi:hypothetical protein
MGCNVQALQGFLSPNGRPPQRILGLESEALHPIAQSVGESKLLADDRHKLVGLMGMEVAAGHEVDRKTRTGDGNSCW